MTVWSRFTLVIDTSATFLGRIPSWARREFPERDGMFFLPEQVNEYDKKRAQVENIGQLTIFVEDERSAINWLRSFLKDRPSVYSGHSTRSSCSNSARVGRNGKLVRN